MTSVADGIGQGGVRVLEDARTVAHQYPLGVDVGEGVTGREETNQDVQAEECLADGESVIEAKTLGFLRFRDRFTARE